jgi:hypothetical protein
MSTQHQSGQTTTTTTTKTTTATAAAAVHPKIQLKTEPTVPSISNIKTDQMITMLAKRSDIIDSFVMKENQQQNNDAFDTAYDDGEQQWVFYFL